MNLQTAQLPRSQDALGVYRSVQMNLDRVLIEIHKLQEASATDHGDIEVLRSVQGRNLLGRFRWLVRGV